MPAQGVRVGLGGLAVRDVERLAVDAHQVGHERRPVGRLELCLERPVLAGRERRDLALPLHDQAHGDGLDTTRGQAAAHLAGEQRAEGVAHQPVDDAPRLLGVDQMHVDVPGVGERLPDGGLGDLRERHPALLGERDVGGLGDVPRDGLALAVEVGGEVDGRRRGRPPC